MTTHQATRGYVPGARPRAASDTVALTAPLYVAAITGAELLTVFLGALPGLLCHAVLLVLLVLHYGMASLTPGARLLAALALAPLLRITSLALPLQHVPQFYWYAAMGGPLLVSAGLMMRVLRAGPAAIGLGLRGWPWQLLIALLGVPLGLAGYLLLRPAPLVPDADPARLAQAAAMLVLFVGFLEELIFRGLIHRFASEVLGGLAVACSTVLYMAMYMATHSLEQVLFAGLLGLLFGLLVSRTGAIWGVALAHSLVACGMLLVWPLVL